MMDTKKVKQLCRKSLDCVPVGVSEQEFQHGTDFYKYFFTNHPDLRKYFKGAENYDADKVQTSERFRKQGRRLLLAVFVMVDCFEDPIAFKAYAREIVDRHRIFKMEPALWHAFFTVFTNFLSTKTNLDADTKKAWEQLGKEFADECLDHLKRSGLPH